MLRLAPINIRATRILTLLMATIDLQQFIQKGRAMLDSEAYPLVPEGTPLICLPQTVRLYHSHIVHKLNKNRCIIIMGRESAINEIDKIIFNSVILTHMKSPSAAWADEDAVTIQAVDLVESDWVGAQVHVKYSNLTNVLPTFRTTKVRQNQQ